MKNGQFRCAFFALDYEATLSFYGDELGLPMVESWDRGLNDRGTLFAASSGIIEVLATPQKTEEDSAWDYRTPQGVCLVIEVEDVDQLYSRILDCHLTLRQKLKNQPWGHRSFVVNDPNGIAVYFFSAFG